VLAAVWTLVAAAGCRPKGPAEHPDPSGVTAWVGTVLRSTCA